MADAASGRRINWRNALTVVSATILIGAEVFGAAFAGSFAITTLFGLGEITSRILYVVLFGCGVAVMFQFIRFASRIEPLTVRD